MKDFALQCHTNQIYCVTPGKGGFFKCDWNCVNISTKTCERTIAVGEKYGKLPDFIIWYKRSNSSASITKMALDEAPKTSGRKPSTRTRSNRKRPSKTSLVDLLEDCNDRLKQNSNQNGVPPMQTSTAHPVNHIASKNALYLPPIIQQNYQQPQVQRNSLFLKWIAGSTISKCYGSMKKYKILLNLHRMTWLWRIAIFTSLEILVLGH